MRFRKTCIVCQKVLVAYEKAHKGGRGARMKPRRRADAVTCSSNCSKIYTRVYTRLQKIEANARKMKLKNKKKR